MRPITLLLSVEGSRLRTECRIYENRKQMLKAARAHTRGEYPNLGKDTMAYCEGTLHLTPSNRFAVVFLNRKDISLGIVAHELDHAANCLMYRRGVRSIPCSIDMASDVEEQHCYLLGELLDGFHKKFRI